jgi:hypothetical protein
MPSWEVVSMEIVSHGRGDLIGPLRTAIRREGAPTIAAVKAAWLSVEVSSTRGGTARPDRSTGLRARVSAATKLSITSTGIRVTVTERAVDPRYGKALTWYLDASGRRPWRHPVFGHRHTWTTQRGQEVFFSTIDAHAPAFRAAIAAAMEVVAAGW